MATLVCLAFAAHAAEPGTLRGVALVIGNGSYENLPALANPPDDADAIEGLLSGLGFDSVRRSNRDAHDLARDLERFVEDAEGADVAILYYAGHGIQAGGENFLVPVDADISALDDARGKLVPVSDVLRRLQEKVAVTIVLLDACRNNPFPPDATLRLTAGAGPVPIAAGGLAVSASRGASSLPLTSAPPSQAGNFGTVIGFAAAPGQVALDGPPGSNSPYAAAILRHLAAMAGEEFGAVMRMVAEEVWLKTDGRQRPWVNESLRRLLYFGQSPQLPDGTDSDMLKERRRLLITIADLPDYERSQVKRLSTRNGVPMDALFGLLKAMGAEAPAEPERLEEVLKSEAARISGILSERRALASPDPEVVRLSALADSAEREGLIESAKRLRSQAKARDAEFQAAVVDRAEEQVKAQRLASAEVFARSAETYLLSFEHRKAADDFGEAFSRVERWDDDLAWQYRTKQMNSLGRRGNFAGDKAALVEAANIGRNLIEAAKRTGDREREALVTFDLAVIQRTLGSHYGDAAALNEAASNLNRLLAIWTRQAAPRQWARTQSALGTVMQTLGALGPDPTYLKLAVQAYSDALMEQSRASVPEEWAETELNLGTVLGRLGEREGNMQRLHSAIAELEAAMTVYTKQDAPLDWAGIQSNIGLIYRMLGTRGGNPERLRDSVAAFLRSLEARPREQVPLQWAEAMNNLGLTRFSLAQNSGRLDSYDRAILDFRSALEEATQARAPMIWAAIQNNIGIALGASGIDAARLHSAISAFGEALKERRRDIAPLDWAQTQHNIGMARSALGELLKSSDELLRSVEAFDLALQVRSANGVPFDTGLSYVFRGEALTILAKLTRDASAARAARDSIERARAVFRRARIDTFEQMLLRRIAAIDAMITSLR